MAGGDLRHERRALEARIREIDADLAKEKPPHTYWEGRPCTCTWGADHGNGAGDSPDFAQPSQLNALEQARADRDEALHVAADLITWAKASDTAAGAVMEAETRLSHIVKRALQD